MENLEIKLKSEPVQTRKMSVHFFTFAYTILFRQRFYSTKWKEMWLLIYIPSYSGILHRMYCCVNAVCLPREENSRWSVLLHCANVTSGQQCHSAAICNLTSFIHFQPRLAPFCLHQTAGLGLEAACSLCSVFLLDVYRFMPRWLSVGLGGDSTGTLQWSSDQRPRFPASL